MKNISGTYFTLLCKYNMLSLCFPLTAKVVTVRETHISAFIASKYLSVMYLWCEGVMCCSLVPIVGLKIWNCSKYKLLKSFLPHSCSKYSKSQSKWNMCTTWTQVEFFFFTHKNILNHHPPRLSLWPASDRLLTQVTRADFCVTSTCPQPWSKLRAVLPHWNCVGSRVSCVFWPFLGFMSPRDKKHRVSMRV